MFKRYTGWIALFGFCFAISVLAEEKSSAELFRERAHEINELIDRNSIVRPPSSSLSEMIGCRARAMLDPQNILLTEKDIEELSATNCFEAFCVGNVAPMAKMIERIVERGKETIEFLEKLEPATLNLNSDEMIPSNFAWEKHAKDEAERNERFRKLIISSSIARIINLGIPSTDTKRILEVERLAIADNVSRIKASIKDWESATVETKERLFIDARVSCADHYSRIVTRDAREATGSITGDWHSSVSNGMMILTGSNGAFISQVTPDSPADKSGKLRRGDKIVSITVNGKKYDFSKKDEVDAYFRLTTKDGVPFEVEVERAKTTEKVPLKMAANLGFESVVRNSQREVGGKKFEFIGIPRFAGDLEGIGENSPTDVQVARVLEESQGADAIVLDLRDNTGGAVKSAFLTAGSFVPSNTPLLSHSARIFGEDRRGTDSAGSTRPNNLPLFILVNQNTASSAEIVSKALQGTGRAVIIGERSFGKGIQQGAFPLKDGGVVWMTQLVREGIDGTPFHRDGIHPDLFIPSLANTAPEAREQQQVDPQPTRGIADPVPAVGEFWKRDTQRVSEVQRWLDDAAKRPEMRQYRVALETVRRVNEMREQPLNLEKARALADEVGRAADFVVRMGGRDSTQNFDNHQYVTYLALEAASKYLKAIETKAESKK